jgi:HAD superfamily hydrolase (TIGR01662 family)
MLRGVIFDLGNTLMYFDGEWDDAIGRGADALVEFLRKQGLPLRAEFAADFVETRRVGRQRSAREDVEYTAENALRDTLTQWHILHPAAEVLNQALEVYFAPEQERWRLYPDAYETVAALHERGLRLGLLSNATDDAWIQAMVRRAKLAEFLDPIVSSAALPWRKPDPRIFQYVLTAWRLEPREVVMVGDWLGTDILGAHRTGMPAILIEERWSEAELKTELPKHVEVEISDKHLLEPEIAIRNLSELPRALEQLNELQFAPLFRKAGS